PALKGFEGVKCSSACRRNASAFVRTLPVVRTLLGPGEATSRTVDDLSLTAHGAGPGSGGPGRCATERVARMRPIRTSAPSLPMRGRTSGANALYSHIRATGSPGGDSVFEGGDDALAHFRRLHQSP